MLVVDDREVLQHPEIPELLDLPDVRVLRLEAADYSFLSYEGEPVGIERCEIGNFIQKLRSGELESQMRKCEELYSIIFLLIEGVYDSYGSLLATYKQYDRGYFRQHIYPTTRYDYALASFMALNGMGIGLIHTPNFDCSMVTVKIIYKQWTKEEHTLFKRIQPIRIPVKLSANPAVPKLMTLCPRIPEKVAIRLIHKYNTIWNILHIEDKDLLEVEGMGKGLVDKLKRGVGKE